MSIKGCSLFLHSLSHPHKLWAHREISSRKKAALLAGVIAVWVFSLGIAFLISRKLSDRSIKRSTPPHPPIDRVAKEVFQQNSSPTPSQKPLERNRPLDELSLEELSLKGSQMEVEEFLALDLKQLKGKNRIERFKALFHIDKIEEESSKAKEAIQRLSPHTCLTNLDLLELPELKNCRPEWDYPELLPYDLTLSLQDCIHLESTYSDEELSFILTECPQSIKGREEFAALFRADKPRGKKIIELAGDRIREALSLFSEKHWGFLNEKQKEGILNHLGYYSERALLPIVDHLINPLPDEKAHEVINQVIGHIESSPSELHQSYADLSIALREDLRISKRLKTYSHPLKDRIEESDLEPESIQITYKTVATSDKEEFLKLFFDKNSSPRRIEAFQSIPLDENLLFSLSDHHISWITQDQFATLNFNKLIAVRCPLDKEAAFRSHLHELVQRFPAVIEEYINSRGNLKRYRITLFCHLLDEKNRKPFIKKLTPDLLKIFLSELTQEEGPI